MSLIMKEQYDDFDGVAVNVHDDDVLGMDTTSPTNMNTATTTRTATTTTTTAGTNNYELTSTTAPGKIFTSRTELANHYKSQWHKYNLKRREVGLPPLLEMDFQARLQAAQNAYEEQINQKKKNSGNGHLKNKNNSKQNKQNKKKENKRHQQRQQQQQVVAVVHDMENGGSTVTTSSQVPAYERIKQQPQLLLLQEQQQQQKQQVPMQMEEEEEKNDETIIDTPLSQQEEKQKEEEENDNDEKMDEDVDNNNNKIEIDPYQCLFDKKRFETITENIQYMELRYGFFIPDKEYVIDMCDLLGYIHEKILIGNTCIYCQKQFHTSTSCIQHMIQKQHCKIKYEQNIDLHEYMIFYDFTIPNRDFVQSTLLSSQPTTNHRNNKKNTTNPITTTTTTTTNKKEEEETNNNNDDMDEDDEEWEDISDDDDDNDDDEQGERERENGQEHDDDIDDDDDDDVYAGYENEVAAMGLDVTPLGELIFPDGRIIGHRSFRRYYKQRIPSSSLQRQQQQQQQQHESVRIARHAAGDRLYQGRIVNLYDLSSASSSMMTSASSQQNNNSKSLLLAAKGRQGKGLLVPTTTTTNHNNDNNTTTLSSTTTTTTTTTIPSYTQLSIYRYRAAVKKQRKQQDQGQRLYNKTNCNMNRMDKKHNRLMNGVSVAHAAR